MCSAVEVDHLPISSAFGDGIGLFSISNVANANRLSGDQTLSFEPGPSITVIFGKNGAGKSGYARIIKKACRCRGQAKPILPDVRSPTTQAKASANIVILDGDVNHPLDWSDGSPSDHRLGRVFVFDSDCADHYLEESDGTAFTPFGLDVLEKLGSACDTLKQRLIKRQRELLARIEAAKRDWALQTSTSVGKLVETLSSTTLAEEVEALAIWTDADSSRLDQIKLAMLSNLTSKSHRTRAIAARLSGLLAAIRKAVISLDAQKVRELRQSIADAEDAQKAAVVFASDRFDDSFLNGTGNSVWGKLWSSARDFSTLYAYPDQPFPNLATEARCVFCQSNLTDDSRGRLRRFDEFMANQASKLAETTKARVADLAGMITAIPLLSVEWNNVESDLGETPVIHRDQIKDFADWRQLKFPADDN